MESKNPEKKIQKDNFFSFEFNLDKGKEVLQILPIFLVIWILYQFTNLVLIDKLMFFSWSQVINDTIVLFLPILFWISWFLAWAFIEIHTTLKRFSFNLLVVSAIVGVISILLIWVKIPYVIYGAFIFGSVMSIVLAIFMHTEILRGSEKMKNKNHVFILKISGWLLMLFSLFNQFRDLQYKDIYVKIENKNEHIFYMNDQYIFTTDTIIHNKDDVIFNYKNSKVN